MWTYVYFMVIGLVISFGDGFGHRAKTKSIDSSRIDADKDIRW